jgi:hypothetical protein
VPRDFAQRGIHVLLWRDHFDGIYVSSDRDKKKNKFVYLVLASDFIALCCDIGKDVCSDGSDRNLVRVGRRCSYT